MEPETARGVAAQTRRRRLRLVIRGICLLGAVAALWPLAPGVRSCLWIPALSPFVAVAGAMASRQLLAVTALGVVVGVVALVRRRFFCRWVCPVGLCMDGASRLGRRCGRRPRCGFRLGRWIVALTLGGACLGFPLLLWLDPLAIFAGVFAARQWHLGGAAWPTAVVFTMILLLNVIWPHVWCGSVCPLGAFQDLLYAVPRSLRIGAARDATSRDAMGTGNGLSRRLILGGVAGAAAAEATRLLGRDGPRPLRPPNARVESLFVGLCTRCSNCLRSCPSGIIGRDLGGCGWAGLWTPVVSFRDDYCREDCTRCTEVCPSGAIVPLNVGDKGSVRIGVPRVDMNVCLLSIDRECSVCARWCPYGAIRYRFSQTEYTLTPEIDFNRCNGCGACEAACPTRPERAIVILPV